MKATDRFIDGNTAVAYSVAQTMNAIHQHARIIGIVSGYPITPNTEVLKVLNQAIEEERLKAVFRNSTSEHAGFGILKGAALLGAPAFTASSSQGIALGVEELMDIAFKRLPVVLFCASRAVGGLNILNDLSDMTRLLVKSGWVVLVANTGQEAYDLMPIAFGLANTAQLPVVVCLDGFRETHRSRNVGLEENKKFLKFFRDVGWIRHTNLADRQHPTVTGQLFTDNMYEELTYAHHRAIQSVGTRRYQDGIGEMDLFRRIAECFRLAFDRQESYDVVSEFETADAELIIVSVGSFDWTVRSAVKELRDAGIPAGALSVRLVVPFPYDMIRYYLRDRKAVVVIDRSFDPDTGYFLEKVRHALYDTPEHERPAIEGTTMALGGRYVRPELLTELLRTAWQNLGNGSPLSLPDYADVRR